MVHHSASWSAKTHQAGGYTATPLGRWYWHVSCVLCSFSTTAASYEPTLGVWAGVSPRIQKRSSDVDSYPKHIQNHIFLADFNLNCYNAYAAAHPHFRASWCITGASCTVKVFVHHNASPVHHTVHHRVHQKGALRCIKAVG